MEEDKTVRVYSIADIQKMLKLGRNRAYEYIEEVYQEQKPFRVLKIGKVYKIPKESFDEWLNGKQ